MGASPRHRGQVSARLAAFAIACAGAALCAAPIAAAQSRSPAGDKAGPRAVTGSVVQFEERPGSNILYLEQGGGLVTPLATAVRPEPVSDAAPKGNGARAAEPKAVARATMPRPVARSTEPKAAARSAEPKAAPARTASATQP